ncbi:FAD-binding oxidoreductase [Wenzhouxiangella limi]|uniref:FAD-binding oxidoreductase n=1 Tax=Wenzhouxiangella limi TaxID=2707351 RepID=A0A845V223_9GAMM|nr:FAD-binding oxidoreductase [Wenzhouxiangella limi]NDY96642.1 FAD-binding oxidoreductase [Wenzhouxiangella limi]
MTRDFLADLAGVLDAPGLLLPGQDLTRYEREWRGRYESRALAVARPADVAMLSALVECCLRHGVAMVPQGGNTGLVGGAVACGERRELLISLERLRAVRKLDSDSACLTVEAGCTLGATTRVAAAQGWRLPLALASGDSATIGGVLATNAGGNETIRFGNARHMVLGLEAVLADGSIWRGLSPLRKDNAGYDLAQLLVGSEGTLGIITAASLALKPLPRQREVAWLAVPSPASALAVLRRVRQAVGETITAFEVMPALAIEFALAHRPGARCPVDPQAPWHVLLDCDCAAAGQWLGEAVLECLEAECAAENVTDVVVAQSQAQADAFWQIRESISDAQKAGGVSLKHDISVPIAAIPGFIDQTLARLRDRVPGIRPCVFGHFGDGNLHFNLTQPREMAAEAFRAREEEINELVFSSVLAVGGSIAAEHGIGLLRKGWMAKSADPAALFAMQRIKRALDPLGLMNPGKVLEVDYYSSASAGDICD